MGSESVCLPEDVEMKEVGESLTTVACSASIISRSQWFWDNFNIGKIIHPTKDLTSEAGAMGEISVLESSGPWKSKADISRCYRNICVIYGKLLNTTSGFTSQRIP